MSHWMMHGVWYVLGTLTGVFAMCWIGIAKQDRQRREQINVEAEGAVVGRIRG